MKILKRLFVGSIILLMLTTSLLVTAGVSENKNPSTLNVSVYNSLGTLQIQHVPLYYKFFENHGIWYKFFPPEDNPGYDYYFCEVDGEVLMNFSLKVEHRLNEIYPFFADRYTWINDLWIGNPGVDYFRVEHMEPCEEEFYVTYYVNLTEDMQFVPLETNGEDVTVQFWLLGLAAVTNSSGIWTILEFLPGMKQNFLSEHGSGHIDLTIHPIQC